MGLTKEVTIPAELFTAAKDDWGMTWVTDKVTIKRMTFKDTLDIQNSAMKVKATLSGSSDVSINASEMQVQTILKGVTNAPWQYNDAIAVGGIPPFIATWVTKEIEEFNTLEVKKNLS